MTTLESYLLAEIPPDINGSLGKFRTSDVYAVSGLQRKKRSEVALAIDHQGINVYDIRQSKLVTSYAVAPQAVFTCPPCSIRYRSSSAEPAQRVTYCSIRSPRPWLFCFVERLDSSFGTGGQIARSSIELRRNSSPVVHLESISVPGKEDSSNSNVLLAIYQDGAIECHEIHLAREEQVCRPSSVNGLQVQLATLTSIRQARDGLLKNREDILASISSVSEQDDSNLLILLLRAGAVKGRNKSAMTLVVLSVGPNDMGYEAVPGVTLREAALIDVQEPDHPKSRESAFTLHTASGTLYQRTKNDLSVYDLTGLVPKIAHEISTGNDDITSLLRISSNTIAMSKRSSFSLIGLPYCSIQAEYDIAGLSTADSPKTDRKSEALGSAAESLELLSYFPPLNTIIARKGRQIMVIQADRTQSGFSGSRKRKREGMLVGALGRGSCSIAKANATRSRTPQVLGSLISSPDTLWNDQKTDLDRQLVKEVELIVQSTASDSKASTGNPDFADKHKWSLLLSELFTLSEEFSDRDEQKNGQRRLILDILPKGLLWWILERGLFQPDYVEAALQRHGSLRTTERLAPGALIRAIVDFDKSLQTAIQLLESRIPLNARELGYALVVLIQQWNVMESFDDQKLITKDETFPDLMEETNDDEATSLPSAFPLATSTASAYRFFNLVLSRLSHHPTSAITPILRSQLTKPQLLDLVNMLRLEIARSGWLSPYDDAQSPEPSDSHPNDQLPHIAHLFNSTIDAIGAGGWVVGSGTSDDVSETADTISYMKAEISAALEGIQEAVYLKGMLGEILLCGKDNLLPSKPRSDTAAATTRTNNAPITMPSLEEGSSILPLGLKLEKKVPVTKVGAGGELLERSRRDVGRLKSRMVGKYSFERIVV